MLCYTTVDTNYHGPPPLDNPPTDLVTVSVKANISGSSVIRTVTVRRDTTISSLIEAILKIQDNNSFPTSITRFSSSNTGEASITSLTPRVAKTTWSYKTFDAIVTDTPTSWTPSTSTNIQSDHNQSTAFQHNYINIHDPFCKLWTRLTRPAEDYVVKLDQESMSLQFQNMQLTLQRTLRVQNDLCTHSMPASLGPLQLVNVARLADKLADCIRSRGGLLVPMYHHEAMRIAFQSSNRYPASRRKIAVRAYVGGINAVSGNPGLGLQSILAGGSPYVADGLATPQDYVVIPLQTHLDGIMIGTTKVRQFVATPLDQGTTIEAQLTGIDMLGGLQLEFIPSFDTKFSIGHPYQHCPAITTPPEAGMAVGTVVQLRGPPEMGSGEADYTIADYQAMFGLRGPDITLRIVNEVIYLEEESGEILTLAIEKPKVMYIYQLRAQIRTQLGEKYDFRPLFFDATMLDDFRTLEHYNITFESTIRVFNPRLEVTMDNVYPPNLVPAKTGYGTDGFISMPGSAMRKRARRRYATMGISAGAKIKQIIHRDRSNRRIWDLEATSVVNIQILNALDFARITNIQPHPSPITRETYMNMGLPWFEEEDEGIEALQNIDCSARFSNLITILPENPPTSATNTSVLLLALGRAISEKRNAITLPCRKDDETEIAETQSDQQTTQPSNSAPTPKHTESLQLPWRPWYNSPEAPAFMRGSYPSLPPLTTAHFNPRGDRPRLTAEN